MNLSNGGVYEAERGKGAQYNGETIKPSGTVVLKESVLSVDISRTPEIIEKVVPLMKTAKSVRSLGSAALEICYVASGLLEAYVDVRAKLRTLDIAGGMMILREAGGFFVQPDGKGFEGISLTEMNRFSVIAAGNQKIHDEIISLIGS